MSKITVTINIGARRTTDEYVVTKPVDVRIHATHFADVLWNRSTYWSDITRDELLTFATSCMLGAIPSDARIRRVEDALWGNVRFDFIGDNVNITIVNSHRQIPLN